MIFIALFQKIKGVSDQSNSYLCQRYNTLYELSMGKHIIAIIVCNRKSMRTSLLEFLFFIASFEAMAIGRTYSLSPTEKHDSYRFYNEDDIGPYDDLSLLGDDELYQYGQGIGISDLFPEKGDDAHLKRQFPQQKTYSETPLGKLRWKLHLKFQRSNHGSKWSFCSLKSFILRFIKVRQEQMTLLR